MCKTCEIKIFPNNTDVLKYYNCKRKVIKLPSPLPEGLEKLIFSDCRKLTRLPDPLPEGLIALNCYRCQSLLHLSQNIYQRGWKL